MSAAYELQETLFWRRETARIELPPPPPDNRLTRIRALLPPALARGISSGSELIRSREKEQRGMLPTTITSFDTLLGGGLPRGTLTQLVSRRSAGRFSTVISTLAAITSIGEPAALVDLGDHLDPGFSESAGVDLSRLFWVRPEHLKDAVLVAEMILAAQFPLVVIELGSAVRGRRPHESAWMRLARTAKSYGAALLVSTPFSISGAAADVVVTMPRSDAVWRGSGASPRLLDALAVGYSLEKHRMMRSGKNVMNRFRSL